MGYYASLSALLLLSATAGPAPAGAGLKPPGSTSWPSYRNGNLQRGVAGGSLPEKLQLLWKKKTAHGVVGTAAIVGDRVYLPALSGRLFCLDKRTGREIWNYRSIESKDPDEFAPGFRASPTVTADAVYVGDEDGVMHAIERATGKKRWSFSSRGEIAGGAAVLEDTLIFGSQDGNLYRLKTQDGKPVWKFQPGTGPIICSPAVAAGHTFTAGCESGDLLVVDLKAGKEKSRIPLETHVLASPAVLGNMLYLGTYAGEVVAIDWKKGRIVWRYDPEGDYEFHASVAVTEEHVVAGGRDKLLHLIDRRTGRGVWTFRTRAQINSSPVVVGGRVFFGSNDRNIYGVRLKDGREVFRFHAAGTVTASPAVGEGVLVIGTEKSGGYVYCFGEKK